MTFRLSIIAAVLCLFITIPGACLGASQELATPEPAWLHRMLQLGWQKVQPGVLQRDMDGGRVETFTHGQEGLRWTAQKLQERIRSLQHEYAQHPSPELAGLIASLQSESTQTDSSLKTAQTDAFAAEPVTAACEPTFGVHAAADPLTGSQGVTASADASYSSPCGDLGNVYSYAYARATLGSTMAVKSEEDSKLDGTALASAVTVSVNGSLDCYSEAYARAWSPTLNIGHETSDTNFSCPGATSPGSTPSSPSGWTDDGAVVRLTNASDRVGIGTAVPTEKLHIFENADDNSILVIENPHLGSSAAGVLQALSDSTIVSLISHGSGRTRSRFGQVLGGWSELLQLLGNGLILGTGNSKPLILGTSNRNRFHITSGGSIGVGTSEPASLFHVNGGDVRVTGGSFIDDGVTLNTPDYVFEPGYSLRTLAELKAYIDRERHLPNIPSAAEIKANGLRLGQFQMLLLEKIEELTLYTIQQDEEIGRLRARNTELEKRFEDRLSILEQALGRAVVEGSQ